MSDFWNELDHNSLLASASVAKDTLFSELNKCSGEEEQSPEEAKQTITEDPLMPTSLFTTNYFPDPYSRFPDRPWEAFDRMLREDSRAGTNNKKRSQLLLSKGINVLPNEENPQGQTHKEFVDRAFEMFPVKKNIAKIANGIAYGFQALQLLYKEVDGWIYPCDFRMLPHKDFRIKTNMHIQYNGTLYRNPEQWMVDLFQKYPYRFIWHTHEAAPNNDPRGVATFARAYWYWKFKNQDLASWVKLVERYGSPSLIAIFKELGKFDTVEEKANFLAKQLTKLKYSSTGAMTGVEEIKMLETNSDGDVFDKLATLCNDEIDMATLGTTMLSAPKGGSYALADVHGEVLKLQTQADGEAIAETLNNTLIKWMIDLNFGEQESGYPIFEFNFQEFASWDQLVQAMDKGIPVSEEALYTTYNIPRPQDENDAFVVQTQTANTTPIEEETLSEQVKKKSFLSRNPN